jgi:hypothetical protein
VEGAREAKYTIAIENIPVSRLEIGPALAEYVSGIAKTSALGRFAGNRLWVLRSEDSGRAYLIPNGQGLLGRMADRSRGRLNRSRWLRERSST